MPETKMYLSKIAKDGSVIHIKDTEAQESIQELLESKADVDDVAELIADTVDSTEVAGYVYEKILGMELDQTTGVISLTINDNSNNI